jgi:transketolase
VIAEVRPSLEDLAFRVREHAIRMAGHGGCFLGSALSCADLLAFLYGRFLRISPRTRGDENRDYFLLSKGHAVPALYGVLAELGFMDRARLQEHLLVRDHIYWHPHPAIPGVEFRSGSLGHLLPVGIGIAMDVLRRGGANRVVVLAGDGELNEGSMWEGLQVAHAHGLHNLLLVVDRNGLQANLPTEVLSPLEPLEEKFAAFGWATGQVDGHDFDKLEAALARFPDSRGRPTVLVAHTMRGRGVPSLEHRLDGWFVQADLEQTALLLREHADHRAKRLPDAAGNPV